MSLSKRGNKKNLFRLKTYLLISIPTLAVIIVSYLIFHPKFEIRLDKEKLKNLNIMLITIDTLRWDYVSAYSSGKAQTPILDRLAEEGTLFKTCIAQVPLTLPSHATILSGTYPLGHHVSDNSGFQVPDQLQLISEVLRNHGYLTSAFIGCYVLHRKTGMSQGFDHYADEFDVGGPIFSPESLQKRADEVLNEARKWLLNNKDHKYFTWIHLFDPHTPYTPPSPYKEKFPDNPYRGEVEYTDSQLGHFIAFLKEEGLYDNCLIIVTSDHGEGLGDHGEQEHGFFLYESTVRVPLVICAPFDFSAKFVKQTVEHVDLVPTILDVLDVPIPEFCQGSSFLNLMFHQKRDKSSIAYSETYYPRRHFGWSELKALYWNNWKYIEAPKEELYDLSHDASEANNLVRHKSGEKEKLSREMKRFIQEKSIAALTAAGRKSLDKEEIERLTALGYLTSVVNTAGKLNLPDPKDKIQVVNDLEKAKKYFDIENFDLAIPLIKAVIDSNPGMILAHHLLGNCYFQKEMYAKALENYRFVLTRQPDFIIVTYDVIECLSRMGKIDVALKEAKKFLADYPEDYTLLRKLASLYYSRREYDQALDILNKLYQMNETDPEVLRMIVNVYIIRKDFENARLYVKRSLEINPSLPQAHFLFGQIESAQGNSLKAIDLYKEELALNPQNSQATFYLAEELRLSGDYSAAILYYRKTIDLDPGFNVPYFVIAKYLLMRDVQITEAIRLCEKGISIEPKNQYTFLGYSLLMQIYSKLGDREKVYFYTSEAKKLQALLE